jgi:pilus assembly protein Flp/PilA
MIGHTARCDWGFRIMKKFILRFLQDESGPTATEYAVMLALIIGSCIAAITLVGGEAGGSWQNTSSQLDTFMNAGSS